MAEHRRGDHLVAPARAASIAAAPPRGRRAGRPGRRGGARPGRPRGWRERSWPCSVRPAPAHVSRRTGTAALLLHLAPPLLLVDATGLGRPRRLGGPARRLAHQGVAEPSGQALRAMSRSRSCERSSSHTTRTSSPSTSTRRARWNSLSDGLEAMSKRSSTRVFDRLACWPPGPPEGMKRSSSSEAGITSPRRTSRSSATASVSHRRGPCRVSALTRPWGGRPRGWHANGWLP